MASENELIFIELTQCKALLINACICAISFKSLILKFSESQMCQGVLFEVTQLKIMDVRIDLSVYIFSIFSKQYCVCNLCI